MVTLLPGRVATLPADAHLDLAMSLQATFYRSEVQDIEIPARFARQRQEPAEHWSQSSREDEPVVLFFQRWVLTLLPRHCEKPPPQGEAVLQYSLGNITVRTRWVSPSLAGLLEGAVRVRSK